MMKKYDQEIKVFRGLDGVVAKKDLRTENLRQNCAV